MQVVFLSQQGLYITIHAAVDEKSLCKSFFSSVVCLVACHLGYFCLPHLQEVAFSPFFYGSDLCIFMTSACYHHKTELNILQRAAPVFSVSCFTRVGVEKPLKQPASPLERRLM